MSLASRTIGRLFRARRDPEQAIQDRRADSRLGHDEFVATLERECTELTIGLRCEAELSYDEDLGFWVSLPAMQLPSGWAPETIKIYILVPRDYPAVPATTMICEDARHVGGFTVSHLFQDAETRFDVPGMNWLRLPEPRWRRGDDLGRLMDSVLVAVSIPVNIADRHTIGAGPAP